MSETTNEFFKAIGEPTADEAAEAREAFTRSCDRLCEVLRHPNVVATLRGNGFITRLKENE